MLRFSRMSCSIDEIFSIRSKALMSQTFSQCVKVIGDVLVMLRKHGTKSRVREVAEGEQSHGTERAGKIRCARMGQWCAAVFIVWIVSAWQLAIRWTALPRALREARTKQRYVRSAIDNYCLHIYPRIAYSLAQSLGHRPKTEKEK